MMKRLTCTLATLTLVMATSIPARAEFKGTFQRNQPWMLEISSGSTDPVAVTVYYLVRDLEVVEIVTVPTAATVQTNCPRPGRGFRRAIVDVDPPLNGTLSIRITQGAQIFGTVLTSTRDGDTFRWVFDVE